MGNNKNNIDITKDEDIKRIYDCAMEVFCDGIAVPSDNHPCGWDWIDFKYVDDILTYKFDYSNISNGIGNNDFEGKTLKEILKFTKGRFLFEIFTYVNWEE